MIRLDQTALDYLIDVARDSGFDAQEIYTSEADGQLPEVTIILRQQGAPGVARLKMPDLSGLSPEYLDELRKALAELNQREPTGILDHLAVYASQRIAPDKFQTLDQGE